MKIDRRFPLFALITTTNTRQQTTHNIHEIVNLPSWFINQTTSCFNVETAEPFQRDVWKITNETDSFRVEQRELEGLDTAKPALLSGEEESKPAASPESTSDHETESEPNIDEPKPMAPKKIESSNNNVDLVPTSKVPSLSN
jgi:hypothetical protein